MDLMTPYLFDLISYSSPHSFSQLHWPPCCFWNLKTKLHSHGLSICCSLCQLNYRPTPPARHKTKLNLDCCALASFISLFKCHFPCNSTSPALFPSLPPSDIRSTLLTYLLLVSLHCNARFTSCKSVGFVSLFHCYFPWHDVNELITRVLPCTCIRFLYTLSSLCHWWGRGRAEPISCSIKRR